MRYIAFALITLFSYLNSFGETSKPISGVCDFKFGMTQIEIDPIIAQLAFNINKDVKTIDNEDDTSYIFIKDQSLCGLKFESILLFFYKDSLTQIVLSCSNSIYSLMFETLKINYGMYDYNKQLDGYRWEDNNKNHIFASNESHLIIYQFNKYDEYEKRHDDCF